MSSQNKNSSLKTVWSDGSSFERSPRIGNVNTNNIVDTDISKSAMSECLENSNMLDIINQPIFLRTEQVKEMNTRELNFTKMNDRELIGTGNLNPYLDGSDYIQDIVNSNNFLQTQNTTQEKPL